MQQVCKALTFPAKVAAAAVLFFKRFYLSFSSLDHDPKNIMLTCIYLACKVDYALHVHLAGDVHTCMYFSFLLGAAQSQMHKCVMLINKLQPVVCAATKMVYSD